MKPMPEDWERAVAVVAHPDDLEYGVAAAVARWTGQGKKVGYVLVTKGERRRGRSPGRPDRSGWQRNCAAPGGRRRRVAFLDHADGLVGTAVPLRRDLAAAFPPLRPEVVDHDEFRPDLGRGGADDHADRRTVGLAVLDACRDAADGWVFPEAGPPCASIRDAYVAAVGEPNYFVDVTDTIDAGIASLREHRAYLEVLGGDFDPDEFLRNMAGFIGLGACISMPPWSAASNATPTSLATSSATCSAT